jgi:hypothetical protein
MRSVRTAMRFGVFAASTAVVLLSACEDSRRADGPNDGPPSPRDSIADDRPSAQPDGSSGTARDSAAPSPDAIFPQAYCVLPPPAGVGTPCPLGTKCRPGMVDAIACGDADGDMVLDDPANCRYTTWECVPAGDRRVGMACVPLSGQGDTCEAGAECIGSGSGMFCVQMCDPRGGDGRCAANSVGGVDSRCTTRDVPPNNYSLCTLPCRLATSSTDCPFPGVSCKLLTVEDTFGCWGDGPRTDGDACLLDEHCGPGRSCDMGACRAGCDITSPCSPPTICYVRSAPNGGGVCR